MNGEWNLYSFFKKTQRFHSPFIQFSPCSIYPLRRLVLRVCLFKMHCVRQQSGEQAGQAALAPSLQGGKKSSVLGIWFCPGSHHHWQSVPPLPALFSPPVKQKERKRKRTGQMNFNFSSRSKLLWSSKVKFSFSFKQTSLPLLKGVEESRMVKGVY